MSPCQTVDEWVLGLFFCRNFWISDPNIRKNTTEIHFGEKTKTKKTIGNGLARFHRLRVPKLQALISKQRRGHWTLNKIGEVCLNQSITYCSIIRRYKYRRTSKAFGQLFLLLCALWSAPRCLYYVADLRVLSPTHTGE